LANSEICQESVIGALQAKFFKIKYEMKWNIEIIIDIRLCVKKYYLNI